MAKGGEAAKNAKSAKSEVATGNLSKMRRDELTAKIGEIKAFLEKSSNTNAVRLLNFAAEVEREVRNKKFGLVFEEHRERVDVELAENLPVLTEVKKRFLATKNTKSTKKDESPLNFLIEGDNLAALKLLEKTHRGKIDVIYIDPPYNTGNKDFIYNDSYVDKTDTFRHSKWLSFMKKRLEIAKRLLSDNGLIFISIDDNEQAGLKLLCDAIFGECNFVTNFSWMRTATASNLSHTIRQKMEYVLCFRRNELSFVLNGGLTDGGDVPLLNAANKIAEIVLPKESLDLRIDDGLYPKGKYDKIELTSDFIVKNGVAKTDLKIKGRFKWAQETVEDEISKGTYFIIKTKKFSVRFQRAEKSIKAPSNLITKDECNVGTNEEGNEVIKQLFGESVFSYSKPPSLIKYLVRMHQNSSATVLDFFAGSGTTGHAVMKLNAEDGGKRKFILVTNNESGICEKVTYERLKRVMKKEKYAARLKYFKVDYVPIKDKVYYEYADELLRHIRELVELENAIDFNADGEIAIAETDKEFERFMASESKMAGKKAIYVGHDVLMGRAAQEKLKRMGIEVKVIPEYYYSEEES